MSMTVHHGFVSFEATAGIFRAGPRHAAFGAPFDIAVHANLDGDSCFLRAALGTLDRQYIEDMRIILDRVGITRMTWVRSRGGVFLARTHEVRHG